MVKFSICIPAYKSRFLPECIQSILQQSVADFELIVLNDCSPEPVEDIVLQYADNRIHYYRNEKNVGAVDLVKNWNKCLHLAKGEYILIMGDDDRLALDYLQTFIELIQAYPNLTVYHCRSKIINAQGEVVMLTPSQANFEHVYDSIWHRLEQYRSNYISDYVYHTESLKQQGGFYNLPLAWGADDITAFIASSEKGIAHTNNPVFEYRSNSLSITSTGNDLQKMEANLGYAQWLNTFLKAPPKHEEDQWMYQYLVKRQHILMQKRKRYTMMLSMRTSLVKKWITWFKHRKRYGLSIKDIVIAAVKSINLKAE